MGKADRHNITVPPDWWEAFERAAKAAKQTVSEWLREAGAAQLPKKVRESLSAAKGVGRPRNPEDPDSPRKIHRTNTQ